MKSKNGKKKILLAISFIVLIVGGSFIVHNVIKVNNVAKSKTSSSTTLKIQQKSIAADEEKIDNGCQGFFEAKDLLKQIKVAYVTATTTSLAETLYSKQYSCPESDECKTSDQIKKNTELLVGKNYHDYTCVYSKDVGMGWVKIEDVKIDSNQADIILKDWVGDWGINWGGGAFEKINISLSGNILSAYGEAVYVSDTQHNFGEFSATTTPDGSVAVFKQGDSSYTCIVTTKRVGKYLLVADNGECGGMNVRFSGLYSRIK